MFTSCYSQEVTLTWMQCGLLCGKGFQKDVTACVPPDHGAWLPFLRGVEVNGYTSLISD